MDVRDAARVRTQARLVELALAGLLAEAGAALPDDRPSDSVLLAVRTAREFAERTQTALGAAMEQLPGYRRGAE